MSIFILDLMLPGESSYDVCSAKSGGPSRSMPILMVTAERESVDQ